MKLENILQPDQLKHLEEIGIDGIKNHFKQLERKGPFPCTCKDCEKQRENLYKQLDHPFYEKVDDFRDEVKYDALVKASKKYKEPFNPESWTIKQLGHHAMSENFDQGVYIVGLVERAEALEKALNDLAHSSAERIAELQKENVTLENQCEYWRLRAVGLQNELNELKGIRKTETEGENENVGF